MTRAGACPCCGSKTLRVVKEYAFRKPGLDPDVDYERFVRDLALERLFILFDRILPGRSELGVSVTQCIDCSFCFTNPRLSKEDIQEKYRAISEYGFTRSRYKAFPAKNLNRRAERIRDLLFANGLRTNGKTISILDVGGAWGYNLLPF